MYKRQNLYYGKDTFSSLQSQPNSAFSSKNRWGRPNLLGRFVVGYDPSNQDYSTIGNMGGEALVTLTLDQIPPHSHRITFKEEKWGSENRYHRSERFG